MAKYWQPEQLANILSIRVDDDADMRVGRLMEGKGFRSDKALMNWLAVALMGKRIRLILKSPTKKTFLVCGWRQSIYSVMYVIKSWLQESGGL